MYHESYLGTRSCNLRQRAWMYQDPSWTCRKERQPSTVAMPSRKSASSGILEVICWEDTNPELCASSSNEASSSRKLGRCFFSPWHAWMKKSLGFWANNGQLLALKYDVMVRIGIRHSSVPKIFPDFPWDRMQHTRQSLSFQSSEDCQNFKSFPISVELWSSYFFTLNPSQVNTRFSSTVTKT